MRIYRLYPEGKKVLEKEYVITIPENGAVSLLQLSDNELLYYFNPLYPSAEDITQTVLQFLYNESLKPEKIKITIIGVDYRSLIASGNNINLVPSTRKDIIGENIKKRRSQQFYYYRFEYV